MADIAVPERAGALGLPAQPRAYAGSIAQRDTIESLLLVQAPHGLLGHGVGLEANVEALLLRALEPASLELSLAVAADLDAERTRAEALWQQRLERTQYDVDRSRRQSNAVEPESRLVARTIERQLEEHLSVELKLQEDHRRYRAERPATLTEQERADPSSRL